MLLAISIFLWVIVAALMLVAAQRGRVLLNTGLRSGFIDFLRQTPRVAIGVIGSGYLAEVLPHELMASWLGPGSGLMGTTIAAVAGALTPGGVVVGFSLGVAALKSGAGAPQVIAYTTAWALFSFQRIAVYETLSMPARVVWLRACMSIPVPFIAAILAMLLGQP